MHATYPLAYDSAAFRGDPAHCERARTDLARAVAAQHARRAALFAAGRVTCPWCSTVVDSIDGAVIVGADGLHASCAAEFYDANPVRAQGEDAPAPAEWAVAFVAEAPGAQAAA